MEYENTEHQTGTLRKIGSKTIVQGLKNSGATFVHNGEFIAHGLLGKPTNIQITCGNVTYGGELVLDVRVKWENTNSTHFQVNVYWVNGTAITDDVIYITWTAER